MIVGVLGAGQLGRMLALAGLPMGIRVRCLDPADDPPAAAVAECITAPYEDEDAVAEFLNGLHVTTYEFENVPRALAEGMVHHVDVLPPPAALIAAQDRLEEKALFTHHGIRSAPYVSIEAADQIAEAAKKNRPAVRAEDAPPGYDGKGQVVLRKTSEVTKTAAMWGNVPSIVERFIPFERELSLIAVRGRMGETRFYPLVENFHEDGILRVSIAPADDIGTFQRDAQKVAIRLMDALGYVGVLALEFFVHGGKLMVNEMAPRVHNSGALDHRRCDHVPVREPPARHLWAGRSGTQCRADFPPW